MAPAGSAGSPATPRPGHPWWATASPAPPACQPIAGELFEAGTLGQAVGSPVAGALPPTFGAAGHPVAGSMDAYAGRPDLFNHGQRAGGLIVGPRGRYAYAGA